MHLGKRQSALFQEQVTGVFCIVEVVGVVHNAFDVALIVAHLHAGFENKFIHSFFVISLFRYYVIPLFRFLFQIFITNATAQAILFVAVFLLQLDKGLRVACRPDLQTALLPHADDVVVFGF